MIHRSSCITPRKTQNSCGAWAVPGASLASRQVVETPWSFRAHLHWLASPPSTQNVTLKMSGSVEHPNTDALLDPSYARDEAWRHFRPQLEVAREIAEYSSDLLKRAFASNKRSNVADLIVIAGLFRQALASFDGALLCLENGAVHAAQLQTRALWEASLFIEWILTQGKDRWGRQLYVYSIRQELAWVRRVIDGSPEHAAHAEAWRDAFGYEWEAPEKLATEMQEREREILNFLQSGPHRQINQYFENWNRKGEPDWYKVGPDAPSSLYAMAVKVGRRAEYTTLYKSWSYHAHGVRTNIHFRMGPAGMVTIEPIRYLADFPQVFTVATSLALRVLRTVLHEYREGEFERLRQKYIESWRPRLTPPHVKEDVESIEW